jgi:serine/threonine protein kinase
MIGSTLGEYQIVKLIGQGGMGAVYEAMQQKIGRRVALKVLLPEFATNPELIERFFNASVAKNHRRRITDSYH